MKARLVLVLASTTLAAAALSVTTPAQADPVPDAERLTVADISVVQFASGNVVAGAGFELRQCGTWNCDGPLAPAGTQVRAVVSSCGNVIREHSLVMTGDMETAPVWFTPDGQPSFSNNEVNDGIGRSFEYALTITQPGYDPFTLTGSTSAYTVQRPSCEVINGPGYGDEPTGITVTRWSVKKGGTMTAKVGKSLGVTPTRATGSKVTYAWKVGTKTVDRDRVLFVRKTYKGKKVTMRVTVSKAGAKSVSKTLRYGTAR